MPTKLGTCEHCEHDQPLHLGGWACGVNNRLENNNQDPPTFIDRCPVPVKADTRAPFAQIIQMQGFVSPGAS